MTSDVPNNSSSDKVADCTQEIEGSDGSGDVNIVEELDPEEWELVDEECITLDLVGLISEEKLKTCNKNRVKLIGLFDQQPVLQMGNTWFVGSKEEVAGTNVLFKIQKDSIENTCSSEDDEDEEKMMLEDREPKVKLTWDCQTRKKLVMQQAFISKKTEHSS